MANPKSCTHIKVSGIRCGSPALRGEQFCYFHQRMLRTVRYPASRIRHAALIEDEESIQVALMETINALLRGTLEIKRAELILRALNTAVRNVRRVHFGLHADSMVKEIPNYPTPPLEQVDEEYANELHRQAERAESARAREEILAEYQASQNKAKPADSTPANAAPATAATPNVIPTNVGTAAPGCPGGLRSTGPQRTATEARHTRSSRSRNPQAPSKCERSSRKLKDTNPDSKFPSSEGAQECSPQPALSEAEGAQATGSRYQ